MRPDIFYERTEVTHEVVEAKRSEVCYDLILGLMPRETNRPEKLLDIGCGDGSFSTRLVKRCEVFGIDVSQKAIDLARRAGVNAYKADVSCQKLPFDNEYFGIIYMGDIIEHLLNPDFAIKEVARVLKSDGVLVLSTPNLASWLNRLLLVVGLQPLSAEVSTVKNFGRHGKQNITPVGHLRLFTYRALKEFLAYYQFRILKVKGAPFGGLPRALEKVDMTISNIPSLSSILVLEARKMTKSSCTTQNAPSTLTKTKRLLQFNGILRLGARGRLNPVGHLRLFTYSALRGFLTYYRFSIIRTKGVHCDDLPKFLRRIDSVISRIPSLS